MCEEQKVKVGKGSRGIDEKPGAVIQVRHDGALKQGGGCEGGVERSHSGYILKIDKIISQETE